MVVPYLKLKFRIAYRVLAEIGLFRMLFLLPFVGVFFFVMVKLTNQLSYSWIILILIYVSLILHYNFSRKDFRFLKITLKKYWLILFIDNIFISIPFIILDFKITPILFLFAYLIAWFHRNELSNSKNFKLTRSIFITGSIEWESTFRQYNVYMLVIWLLAFIFSIVIKEKYFAFIALGGLGVDAGTIFLKTEPLWYLKQYRNRIAFLKHNFRRIIFNVGLPFLIFDAVIIAFFPAQFEILISIYFAIIFYLLAAFTIRLAVFDNQLLLNVIQIAFLALIISSFFNMGFLILLFLFLLYISTVAYKNLKVIYD